MAPPRVVYSRGRFSWSAPASGGTPTFYTVKVGTTPGGPYTYTVQVDVSQTSVESFRPVPGPGGPYYAVITATNAGGDEGAPSAELSFYADLTTGGPSYGAQGDSPVIRFASGFAWG